MLVGSDKDLLQTITWAFITAISPEHQRDACGMHMHVCVQIHEFEVVFVLACIWS